MAIAKPFKRFLNSKNQPIVMRKPDWLEIILYASLGIILAWAIGKALGFIQSPAWIEVLPFIAIPFAAGAGYQKIKGLLDNINSNLGKLARNVNGIDRRLSSLETEHKIFTEGKDH